MNTEGKQLVRSNADAQVAGVCAGLADYLGVDVTLIRLAFVVTTLMGGPGFLAYIALWIVMPKDVRKSHTVDVYEQEKPKRF